jgi:hypothetical protein
MTAPRFPRNPIPPRGAIAAIVLLLAASTQAMAQFPPPPGQASQSSAFPPPPAPQQQQQTAPSPFPPAPAPGAFSNAPAPTSGGFGGVQQGGFGVRPGGFSSAPPPSSGPSEAQRVCLTFPAIREEVEKGAAGIRSASERKASREEVCPLFKSFAAKEAKMVKFLETNQKLCGVPPNVVTQVKQNHAKTVQIRNNVCNAAPAAAGPTLSDALGGPVIADDTNVRTGRGTFDTLTGNALQR